MFAIPLDGLSFRLFCLWNLFSFSRRRSISLLPSVLSNYSMLFVSSPDCHEFVVFFFFYSFYGRQKASKQNGIVRTNCSKFTQTGVLDHPITQERWSRLKKIIIQKQRRSNINTHATIHKKTSTQSNIFLWLYDKNKDIF